MRRTPTRDSSEPPSDPPYLNPTASWYLGDVRFLFEAIRANCGLPTAQFIFETCVGEALEHEKSAASVAKSRDARQERAPIKLPSAREVADADRHQICVWWARLRGTDQRFSRKEKKIIGQIAARYVEVGGYPAGFDERKLPPIRKRTNDADAELVEIFDKADPKSRFSAERAKRGGKLTMAEFAALLVPAHGQSAQHVLRKLKFQRTGR